jgi:hypothetical protein
MLCRRLRKSKVGKVGARRTISRTAREVKARAFLTGNHLTCEPQGSHVGFHTAVPLPGMACMAQGVPSQVGFRLDLRGTMTVQQKVAFVAPGKSYQRQDTLESGVTEGTCANSLSTNSVMYSSTLYDAPDLLPASKPNAKRLR